METENLNAVEVAEKIIQGDRLKISDDLKFFLESDLENLQAGANLIQKNFAAITLIFAQ